MRAADLGISIGPLPHGPTNSMLDVPGVGVGHATVWRDEPPPPDGTGVARTGVTVVDIGGNVLRNPVPAGVGVLNGNGECTGVLYANECGLVETPIFLTSTMQVGRVFDAAVQILVEEDASIGVDDVVIPVVAECDDSFLSESRRVQVDVDDVRAALRDARASVGGSEVLEGAVGAGTGMSALGYKGGIGTASRVLPDGRVVAVLALTNFGERERLTVDGVPVGRLLPAPDGDSADASACARPPRPAGSCIVVAATDGRLDAAGCRRLATRAGLGLARVGSTAHNGSGEIFIAFATGLRAERGAVPPGAPVTGAALDPYFAAAVDATEESVLNSLLAARTVVGRDGNTSYALPVAAVRDALAAAGRAR